MNTSNTEQRYGIDVSMYDKVIDDNRICFFGVEQRFTYTAPQDYCGIDLCGNYTPVDSTGEYGDVSNETLADGHSYLVRYDGLDKHGNEIIRAVDLNERDKDPGKGSVPLGVTVINAMLLIAVQMLMPANALADEWTDPSTNYTWEYRVTNDEACLEKGPDATGTITIPAELGGHAVTEIGDEAFQNHNNISEVIIPASVTKMSSLDGGPFSGCKKLSSVIISGNVEIIPFETFKGCTNLAHICLPAGIKSIGKEAFKGCTNLAHICLPGGIESIGDEAFAGCSSLKEINFPKSIRNIGWMTFEKCVGLKSVQFNNEKEIDLYGGAFADCTELESVSFLGEGEVHLTGAVFRGCTNLGSITVNANCSAIRCSEIKNRVDISIISGKQVFEIHDFDFSRLHTDFNGHVWKYIKNRIPYCNSGDELVSKFPATGFCKDHPALYKDFCAGADYEWCLHRFAELRQEGQILDKLDIFDYHFEMRRYDRSQNVNALCLLFDEDMGILKGVEIFFPPPGVSVESLDAKFKKKTQRGFMEKLTSKKPRIVERTIYNRIERIVYIDNDELSVSGKIDSTGMVDEITIRSRKLDEALAERDRKGNEVKAKAKADAAKKKEANALNF